MTVAKINDVNIELTRTLPSNRKSRKLVEVRKIRSKILNL